MNLILSVIDLENKVGRNSRKEDDIFNTLLLQIFLSKSELVMIV